MSDKDRKEIKFIQKKDEKSAELTYRLAGGEFPSAENITFDKRALELWHLGLGSDDPTKAQGYAGDIFVTRDKRTGKLIGEGYLLPAYNIDDGQKRKDKKGDDFPSYSGNKPFFAVSEEIRHARAAGIHKELRRFFGLNNREQEGYNVVFGVRKGQKRLFCWIANRGGRNRRSIPRDTPAALECRVAHFYDTLGERVWADESFYRSTTIEIIRIIEKALLHQLPLENGQLAIIEPGDEDFRNSYEDTWNGLDRPNKDIILMTNIFWLLRYKVKDREDELNPKTKALKIPANEENLQFFIRLLKQMHQQKKFIPLHLTDKELIQQIGKYRLNLSMDQGIGQKPDNSTIFMLAARAGCTEVVKELIAAGVNIDAVNDEGFTGLQLAKKNGNSAVVELIQQAKKVASSSPADHHEGNGIKFVREAKEHKLQNQSNLKHSDDVDYDEYNLKQGSDESPTEEEQSQQVASSTPSPRTSSSFFHHGDIEEPTSNKNPGVSSEVLNTKNS